LGADIDLVGYTNFEPIGTIANPFLGLLDGNGFAIDNLTINRPTEDNVGLFGVCEFDILANNPNLKNIILTNTNIVGKDNVGALVGKLLTTQQVSPEFNLVLNCSSTGTVDGEDNVGGLIGLAQGPGYDIFDDYDLRAGCINTCYSAVTVTGSGSNIGGLIGQTVNIKAYKSHSSGVVTGGNVVGGLIGLASNNALFDFCYALGNITGTKVAGGLIGATSGRSLSKKSYAEGDVVGTENYTEPEIWNTSMLGIGGLIGYTYFEGIDRCYALGNVTGYYRVGGLVGAGQGGGYRSPNITDSFAQGNVSGVSQVGGMIGYAFPSYLDLRDLYCTGSVTASSRKGAIIGMRGAPYFPDDPIGKITYHSPAYYNSDANTASNSLGGEGKTTAELGLESTYEDWLSWSYWVIDQDESLYPILKVFYDPLGITISSIKGTTSQGLICSYVVDGITYYRKYNGSSWDAEVEITDIPDNVDTLNMFKTNDDRLGFVTDVDGSMNWVLTEQDSMTVEYTKTLPTGTYGNLIQTIDDIPKIYFINSVQSLSKSDAVFSDDWDDLTFNNISNMTSDSYISRLKAKYFNNKTWIVWRSRGQHRIFAQDETADIEEALKLTSGSITIRQDSPVVSVSLEVDSFDRPEEDIPDEQEEEVVIGYQEVIPVPYTHTEYVQLTTVPEGYIGIYDVADLLNITSDMSLNYIQMSDIDLSGYPEWEPLQGSPNGGLQGIYNGNLYEITGLNDAPLFSDVHGAGSIQIVGKIENLILDNCTNSAIAGNNLGIIKNCFLAGTNRLYFGGEGSIVNCSVNGEIIGFVDGEGTEEDPFLVSNGENLKLMEWNMSAHYRQINDIDLSAYSDWENIQGPPNGLLDGVYDGNGYKVTGLLNDGLFGGTFGLNSSTTIGIIKNVRVIDANINGKPAIVVSYHEGKLTNCYVSGNACVATGNYDVGEISYCTANVNIFGNCTGALCNGNYGSGEIKYCCSSGSINNDGFADVGGLVGHNGEGGNIHDCYSTCIVTAKRMAGGLIGQSYSSVPVKNCFATGNVICTGVITAWGTEGYAGGLIGSGDANIENCYATGEVTCVGQYAGGLAGYLSGSVKESYATGSVNGDADNAGGFAGYLDCETEKCFATGNVVGKGNAGGFAGMSWDKIIVDCYALGDVATESIDNNDCVGGFIGVGGGDWENCYSVGKVTGTIIDIGGFLGWEYLAWSGSDYTITNCYYDSEVSGQSDTGKGEPKTTAELKTQATFTDWDFADTWKLSSITNGYPALVWQLGNDEYVPNYPPSSKIKLNFKSGDSDPYSMGIYYVDRTNFGVGNKTTSVTARNSIGKFLKNQSFDERNIYNTMSKQEMLMQIISNSGITNYFVGTETNLLGIEFPPNKDILSGINDILNTIQNWQIREESDGKVVVAENTDLNFTQPGTYTFYRNKDVFSRKITKDDNDTYGRVCVHTSDFSIKVYRSVSSNLGWLPSAQKTFYQQVPDGTTSIQAALLATEIADRLSNSGEVEEFVGAIRPHLLPGDSAQIIDEDGPNLLGIITTVIHDFGENGCYTQFTVDSGGKINKPLLSDYLKQISSGTIVSKIIS